MAKAVGQVLLAEEKARIAEVERCAPMVDELRERLDRDRDCAAFQLARGVGCDSFR